MPKPTSAREVWPNEPLKVTGKAMNWVASGLAMHSPMREWKAQLGVSYLVRS